MTDRELLELAARAAGVNAVYEFTFMVGGESGPCPHGLWNRDRGGYWNPLADDGDALRLAVKLYLCIEPIEGVGIDITRYTENEPFGELLATETSVDFYAATRRAIVRAAAEIGKEMT